MAEEEEEEGRSGRSDASLKFHNDDESFLRKSPASPPPPPPLQRCCSMPNSIRGHGSAGRDDIEELLSPPVPSSSMTLLLLFRVNMFVSRGFSPFKNSIVLPSLIIDRSRERERGSPLSPLSHRNPPDIVTDVCAIRRSATFSFRV